jgi:hypothetical protein
VFVALTANAFFDFHPPAVFMAFRTAIVESTSEKVVTMLQVLDCSLSDSELSSLSMSFIIAKSCRNDTVVSSRGLQTLPVPWKYACCQQMHFESDHAEQGSCATLHARFTVVKLLATQRMSKIAVIRSSLVSVSAATSPSSRWFFGL